MAPSNYENRKKIKCLSICNAEVDKNKQTKKREHMKIMSTCVTGYDRHISCGKTALIYFPHGK